MKEPTVSIKPRPECNIIKWDDWKGINHYRQLEKSNSLVNSLKGKPKYTNQWKNNQQY